MSDFGYILSSGFPHPYYDNTCQPSTPQVNVSFGPPPQFFPEKVDITGKVFLDSGPYSGLDYGWVAGGVGRHHRGRGVCSWRAGLCVIGNVDARAHLCCGITTITIITM